MATPTTACVPRCRVDQDSSTTCRPRSYPILERMQSVLWATGCRWKVSLSSSFTKMLRDLSSAFQACLVWVSLEAAGMSSNISRRGGIFRSPKVAPLEDCDLEEVLPSRLECLMLLETVPPMFSFFCVLAPDWRQGVVLKKPLLVQNRLLSLRSRLFFFLNKTFC